MQLIVVPARDSLLNWLIGKQFHLSIKNKLLIYNAVIKPKLSYGTELWGYVSKSSIVIMQRSQYKILRTVANAPWYVTNYTVHTDFIVPYVTDVIHETINTTTTGKPIPIHYHSHYCILQS
jgi:hypothetical protein